VPANRIIPSLLCRAGRLVKGSRYGGYRDAGNPATTARAHNAQGADELAVFDINASRDNRPPDLDTFRKIADEIQMPLTVGGGITDLDIARRCMDAGADKLCLTTTAMDNPPLITELAETFGSQAIVLGVDVTGDNDDRALFDHRGHAAVAGKVWTDWMCEGVDRGAGEIRLMAVDREGTRRGFDTELYYTARRLVSVPVILEGGAGTVEDVSAAMAHGVDSVALATMLVFSDNNIVKIKRYLFDAGYPIRL